jgi:hypothetical protein
LTASSCDCNSKRSNPSFNGSFSTYSHATEQKTRRNEEAIARVKQVEVNKLYEKEGILAERRAITASDDEIRTKILAYR